MKFSNPVFLFGLLAILIPVIIHLFNFRRYKTAYFSNVKLLRNILLKTKRESQLQHLVVLFLRILGIAALVFAFAQPYIPVPGQTAGSGRLVTVFVDNSYSMEANSQEGSLLQDAVDAAKNVVHAFDYSDEFLLVTHDFSARESKILNKDEILTLLDEIDISVQSKTLAEIVAFENSIASYSQNSRRLNYYISDFQKSRFDFTPLSEDNGQNFILQMPSASANNISVDSCWFATPVFTMGQQVILSVRLHNYGRNDIMRLPVKLFINDQQRSLSAVDLKANSYADIQMHYNISAPGIQRGVIRIEDTPITFDDELFFVYNVKEATSVIAVERKNNTNKYLRALYGKDSVFLYTEMQEDQVNYSQFATAQLVVLDELENISSGLADELTKFVRNGGNLLVFPAKNMNLESWSSFLSHMGSGVYQELIAPEQPVRVGDINWESSYYKGSMSSSSSNLDMPVILKYYTSSGSSAPSERIISLENGVPLLTSYQVEKGKLFLSAVALDDEYGQAHKHALFFVPLHNIGIMGSLQENIYNIIGRDNLFTVRSTAHHSEDLFVVRSLQEEYEFIPEQRSLGNETILYFHNQIENPGFYNVAKGEEVFSSVAFNTVRDESDLHYYSEQELNELSQSEEHPFHIIDARVKNLSDRIAGVLNGRPLWRYFIVLALLCFLGEIIVLRFWGKARLNRNSL